MNQVGSGGSGVLPEGQGRARSLVGVSRAGSTGKAGIKCRAGLGLPLTAGGRGEQSVWWNSIWGGGSGLQAPHDGIQKIPEAKIPQLLNLPQANLLDIWLIVVHMVHLSKEVTGEVPHVSPLLTDVARVCMLDQYCS